MNVQQGTSSSGSIREQADRAYFLHRAEAELELAQKSRDEDAVRSHYQLAGLYLDLVYNDDAFGAWQEQHEETLTAHAPEKGRRASETARAELGG